MSSRAFLICIAIANAVAGQGCANGARDREFDSEVGKFGSAYLRPTLTPLLSAFFEREGRWPKNWDELGLPPSFQSDPRMREFVAGMTFEVLADGGLQISGIAEQRIPIRFQIPVPSRSKERNHTP